MIFIYKVTTIYFFYEYTLPIFLDKDIKYFERLGVFLVILLNLMLIILYKKF